MLAAIAGIGRFWLFVILATITGLGVWAVVTYTSTAVSGPAGRAGLTRQHNSTANLVGQNKTLLNDSNTVIADENNIKVLAANVVTEQDRMDLEGAETTCDSDVAKYNQDVQGVLAQGLLPAGLPQSYNESTTCEAPTP